MGTTLTCRTIGYYDDGASRGGTTRYLMELLEALDRQRFQPVFFAPQERDWHADLRALDVEVVTLRAATRGDAPTGAVPSLSPAGPPGAGKRCFRPPAGLAWSAGVALELRRLERLFRQRPVDLLHSNNTGAEVAPIAARLAGIPRVLGTWHVDSTYDLAGSRGALRYRLLERASMLALHRAIAVSEATRQDWLVRCRLGARYEGRVIVIHNGIAPERVERQQPREAARARFNLPTAAVVVGSLGRLDPAKGYEYLIRALPEIVRAEPRALVAIAGRGPLETELRELARHRGVESAVRFLGFVANVREALECMDIYVQPSLCEAHPLSLLEAGAMGLPLVVSAVGGMPESIEEGRTGCVVPARDPAALARALIPLLQDRPQREAMGQHARAKSLAEFTRDRMVARTVAVYDEMLRTPPCARGARDHGRAEPIILEQIQ